MEPWVDRWGAWTGTPGEGPRDSGTRIGIGAARGIALFLGAFSLLSLIGTLGASPFDANLWWIDLRYLPRPVGFVFEAMLGPVLVGFAVAPRMDRRRQAATLMVTGVILLIAIVNAIQVWRLQAEGVIRNPHGVPLSFFVGLALAWVFRSAWSARTVHGGTGAAMIALGVCILAFPVLQVFCFGKTDYRRTAAVAVVPGARVYADGRLSDAVADRVRTAAELYRDGWVRRLILSGGPGDGTVHETEAMRRYARSLGVPAESISLDPQGLNTAATVRNTRPTLDGQQVLVVSEFYHLPRLKMAYAHAGQEVYTVPATPRHWLRAWPLRSIAREIPAFWMYWLRGLAESIGTA